MAFEGAHGRRMARLGLHRALRGWLVLYGQPKREPEQREWEHNEGIVAGYTRTRRPVTLVYAERY